MWRETLPRHCSDERLLAHADRELTALVKRMVRRHLGKCWECRARLAELEQQALALAKAAREESFLPAQRIVAAREELLRKQRELERRRAELPDWHPSKHPRLVRGLVAAAAVLAVAAIARQVRDARSVPPPGARTVLAEARREEQRQIQAPGALHAAVRVEFATPRQGPARAGRLEIWTEPGSRYALRWHGGGGELRHAVWRTNTVDRVYFADAVRPPPAYPEEAPATLADLRVGAPDTGAIEAAFLAWLQRWRRQPLSFWADFAAFAGRSGTALRVERPSAQIVRLVAWRPAASGKVEFLAELDAGSRRLRRLLVRFATAGGLAEIHLAVETFEAVPLARVSDAVFQPEVPAIRRIASRGPLRIPQAPRPRWLAPANPDTERLELEVRYALHRLKACLGEPLQVTREAAGRVRVRGLSATEERRDQLVAALAKLAEPRNLAVDIQVPSAPPEPALPLLPESQQHQVHGARLPVEALLEGYFSRLLPKEAPARRIAKLANDALEGAEAALAEAWALRRLAERYPPESAAGMSPEARLLVDRMRRDHLAALWSRLSETRAAAEQPLAYAGGRRPTAREPQSGAHVAPYMELFATVQEVNRGLRVLFAGDEELTRAAGAAPAAREAVQRSAADILAAFDRSEVDFRRVEAEFFGNRRAGEVASDREP